VNLQELGKSIMAAMAEAKEETVQDVFQLNDGHKIPQLGFGTYQLRDDKCVKAVKEAISIGYRHIDTAIFYDNEEAVGKAIKQCKVDREHLFITSKLWSEGHESGKGETLKAVQSSLKKMGTEYIDLYLIHSPHGENNVSTYKELLKCKQKGMIRSVGVSNFGVHHLKALEKAGLPLPAVNQIELHPWLQQKDIVKHCRSKSIHVESYSPLTKGQKLKKKNNALTKMMAKYGKSLAQILLRWNSQTGHVVIAKSGNKERIAENFDTLNWDISDEDMAVLDAMDCEYHCTWDPTSLDIKGSDW